MSNVLDVMPSNHVTPYIDTLVTPRYTNHTIWLVAVLFQKVKLLFECYVQAGGFVMLWEIVVDAVVIYTFNEVIQTDHHYPTMKHFYPDWSDLFYDADAHIHSA